MYAPDLTGLVAVVIVILCISVPLGIWKLFDVIMWIASHVSITF